MSDLDKLARLADLFTQIRDILIQENENNWIRGINSILNQINYSDIYMVSQVMIQK